MKQLIMLVGSPGSGKDTYIKNNFPFYTLINQDEQGKIRPDNNK